MRAWKATALATLFFLVLFVDAKSVFAAEPNIFERGLAQGPLSAGLTAFVGGLLVCLTPCVYPMIAITVSVFGARQSRSRRQAMALSTAYVLGHLGDVHAARRLGRLHRQPFRRRARQNLGARARRARLSRARRFHVRRVRVRSPIQPHQQACHHRGRRVRRRVSHWRGERPHCRSVHGPGPHRHPALDWQNQERIPRGRGVVCIFARARPSLLVGGNICGEPAQSGIMDGGREVRLRDHSDGGGALFPERRLSGASAPVLCKPQVPRRRRRRCSLRDLRSAR